MTSVFFIKGIHVYVFLSGRIQKRTNCHPSVECYKLLWVDWPLVSYISKVHKCVWKELQHLFGSVCKGCFVCTFSSTLLSCMLVDLTRHICPDVVDLFVILGTNSGKDRVWTSIFTGSLRSLPLARRLSPAAASRDVKWLRPFCCRHVTWLYCWFSLEIYLLWGKWTRVVMNEYLAQVK